MSSNSVLRRYTPPTCTLELTAKGSPLSRWFGRPVLKQLQFQLSLDDPRLPEEQRLTLQGDSTQLEELREAVTTYVQDWLNQLPEQLDHSRLPILDGDASTTSDNHKTAKPSLASDFVYPESEADVAGETDKAAVESDTPPLASTPPNSTGIYLQPSGLIGHKLYLGSLATEASGSCFHLSTLQLFDLATALDEYAADVVALPNLDRTKTKGFASLFLAPPLWAKSAATVLLTVGVTAAVMKLTDSNVFTSKANPPQENPTPAATEPQQIASGVLPGQPVPPATSTQTLPALPPNASPGAAALLPPLSGTAASPGLPIPGGAGLAPSPGASPSLRAVTVPPNPVVVAPSSPATMPPALASSPLARSTTGIGSRSSQSEFQIPGSASNLRSDSRFKGSAANSPLAQSPVQFDSKRRGATAYSRPNQTSTQFDSRRQGATAYSRPNQTSTQFDSKPEIAIATRPTSTPIPQSSLVQPSRRGRPVTRSSHQEVASVAPEAYVFPRPGQSSSVKPAPDRVIPVSPEQTIQTVPNFSAPNSSVSPMVPVPTMPPSVTDPSVTALRSAPVPQPEASNSATPTRNASNNAFDPIPQVAEVRKYFQQRWQPPSSLTQDLEYSLVLNPDGSIKKVIPRGQAAETYLDRTDMPLRGERFVAPIENGRSATIIVVLSKDGQVQTFLAASN